MTSLGGRLRLRVQVRVVAQGRGHGRYKGVLVGLIREEREAQRLLDRCKGEGKVVANVGAKERERVAIEGSVRKREATDRSQAKGGFFGGRPLLPHSDVEGTRQHANAIPRAQRHHGRAGGVHLGSEHQLRRKQIV